MNKIKEALKNEFVSGKTWFDWAFLVVGLVLQVIAIVAGFINGRCRFGGSLQPRQDIFLPFRIHSAFHIRFLFLNSEQASR